MNYDEMRSVLDAATRSQSHFEFISRVDRLVNEIEISVESDDIPLIEENIYHLFDLIIEFLKDPDRDRGQSIIAAQVLSAAHHQILIEASGSRSHALVGVELSETHFMLIASLLACSVALDTNGGKDALQSLRRMLQTILERFLELQKYFESCAREIEKPEERLGRIETFDELAQQFLRHSEASVSVGITTAKPGDVLFRNLGFRVARHFGHTAIYLGPDPKSTSNQGLDNHLVIEMEPWIMGPINLPINCVVSTVRSFKAYGGFWGAYSADILPQNPLSHQERLSVVKTALSYENRCRYGVVANTYKNPVARQFRCDGFVEYCYESMSPMAPRLQHRGGATSAGGLFEDDTYLTLSPNSLRSCLFEKVAKF